MINFHEKHNDFLFVPLGGSNEIGINVNLYHYKGKWIMVDCGAGFADDFLPGVDLVVADLSFILERKQDLLAVVLTHAHEDHIGGVQYFIDELDCPVYATTFTANFLRHRLSDYRFKSEPKIIELKAESKISVGPFEIEMVALTHSAPEMQGLYITTEIGGVFHTGDWKFDADPLVGPVSNKDKLREISKNGISALVCDSTNVFNKDASRSEGELRPSLVDIVSGCRKLVVVTTFASNLARLDTLLYTAKKCGRKVILAGRSMFRMFRAAQDSGYLLDSDDVVINEEEFGSYDRSKLMVIATGCQGEPLAATSKMSTGTHQSIKLSPGDTVIFSSKIIPGNDKRIYRMFNTFINNSIEVITERDHFVHVSGHPGLAELREMYELVSPVAVIPVHGEAVHIHEHVRFAEDCGYKSVQVRNGSVVEIGRSHAKHIGSVHTGYLAVDGSDLLPTESNVFKARRRIRDGGIVIVTLILDKRNHTKCPPVINFPGCLDVALDRELVTRITHSVSDIFLNIAPRASKDDIESRVSSCIKRILVSEIGKKPIVIVNVRNV